MGDAFGHLQPSAQAVALLSNEERTAWLRHDRWIHYTRADLILKRLSALLVFPTRDRMPCVLLHGAPGMGKTKLQQKFARDNASKFDEITGVTEMPLVGIQMPPEPVERDFYEEILTAMGSVVLSGQRPAALRQRTRLLARKLGLRVLIIDETHAMLAGTFRQQRLLLNSMRFLANDLHLSLFCVGTDDAKQALMTDQQLADRFEAFELPSWQNDGEFARFLKSLAGIMPLRNPSDLSEPKLRQRILSLTEGITVRICSIVEAVAISAIATGIERMEIEMFTDEMASTSLVSVSDRHRRRAIGRLRA